MTRSLRAMAWPAVLVAVGAAAQEPVPTPTPTPVPPLAFEDQVVVSAGRTERKLLELPVQAVVVTREDMATSASQSVVDILMQQVPSVNLQRPSSWRYSTPPTSSVGLRAMGSGSASRALVLVDGVPLNDPFFGWIPWSRLPRGAVERVEVIPAGAAGAWGNQALSGVINVITKQPQASSLDVDARAGGLDTQEIDVEASHLQGPFVFTPRFNYFHSDGYITLGPGQRGPIDTPSGSDAWVADARVDYNATPSSRFNLQGSYLDDDRSSGRPLSLDHMNGTMLRGGGDLLAGGGALHFDVFGQWRGAWSTRGTVSADRVSETPSRNQFDIPSSSLGAGFNWTRAIGQGRHELSLGSDVIRTEGEVYDESRYQAGTFTRLNVTGGKQLAFGVYAQDVARLAGRLRATLGARVDLWRTFDGSDRLVSRPDGAALRDTQFPSRDVFVFDPNLGLNFQATPRLGLRGAVYRTFRAPTPGELYKPAQTGSRAINQSNPNLAPERVSLGFDAGFDYAAGEAWSVRASGFWNAISDSIADVTVKIAGPAPETIAPCGLVPAGGTCREKQNLEAVRNRGAELELQWRPARDLRMVGSYVYAWARATSAPSQPSLEGRRLRRVPEHQASARAEFSRPRLLTLSLQGRYIGARFSDDQNLLPIDDSFVFDLFVSRRLGSRLELYATAENLFDTPFEVDNGNDGIEYGVPRLLQAGVRFNWQGRRPSLPTP